MAEYPFNHCTRLGKASARPRGSRLICSATVSTIPSVPVQAIKLFVCKTGTDVAGGTQFSFLLDTGTSRPPAFPRSTNLSNRRDV